MKFPSEPSPLDYFLKEEENNHHITLIYGPAASGKTTWCLLASIAIAKEGKKLNQITIEITKKLLSKKGEKDIKNKKRR